MRAEIDQDNSMAKLPPPHQIFCSSEPANTPVQQVSEGEELCLGGTELSKGSHTGPHFRKLKSGVACRNVNLAASA